MRTAAPAPATVSARDRLLAAALRVYARDGLAGATTRGIAREAGVNEVTLFRCFGTKDKLLAAVVEREFGGEEERIESLPATADLAADLDEYARRYEAGLVANLPLVRTFLGEIRHHRACEHTVLRGIFRPLRAGLIVRLRAAYATGQLGPGPEPEVLADLLSGMIFAGVLRRQSLYKPREYAPAAYRAGALALVLALAPRRA